MSKNKIKINSNRSFGLVFFVVFLIITIFPLYKSNDIIIWSIPFSLIFLILGLTNSKLLTPLNKLWFKFGITLGSIMAPIVMGFIFFMVVTPISLLMKLFNKDVLNLKKNKHKSYWIPRNNQKSRMKDQF